MKKTVVYLYNNSPRKEITGEGGLRTVTLSLQTQTL